MKFYYKASFKIYRKGNKKATPETMKVIVTAKNTADAYHNAQKVKNELKGINPDDKVICTRKDIVCSTKPNHWPKFQRAFHCTTAQNKISIKWQDANTKAPS